MTADTVVPGSKTASASGTAAPSSPVPPADLTPGHAEGRAQVKLPPRSPEPAEARAKAAAARGSEPPAPPHYDSVKHLLPR